MVPYHIKILNKYCGLSKNNLIDIKKEEEKYLKYKIDKLQKKNFYISKKNKTKTKTKSKTKSKTNTKTKKININNIDGFINKI